MASKLHEAQGQIVDVLADLSPEERSRVMKAAFALLGDDVPVTAGGASNAKSPGPSGGHEVEEQSLPKGLPAKAKNWMQQNDLDAEDLEDFYHIMDGEVHLLKLPEGIDKKKDQVQATYLLCGIAELLRDGDSEFDDEQAREQCTHFGCYDSTNHSKYMKDFGNRITGSKAAGWKLTVPGMRAAAQHLKGE